MGASLSKVIQPVSWQTEMGARRRLLCPLCGLSQCQGKACLSTCCLSHGKARSRGRHVSAVLLHMHELSFYTKILSWVSSVYKCRSCMALTWSDHNHCDWNLYCLWEACCSMICSSMQTRMRVSTSVVSAPGNRRCTLAIALHLSSAWARSL